MDHPTVSADVAGTDRRHEQPTLLRPVPTLDGPTMRRRRWYHQDWEKLKALSSDDVDWAPESTRHEVDNEDEANLVGSLLTVEPDPFTRGAVEQKMHAPVLDLDFGARLVPSETEGHFHLYLDVEIPHRKYMKLLDALAEAGVIERGYAAASMARGQTFVATKPWKPKPCEKSRY